MSDRRYSQEELDSLRFSGVEWDSKPALVFVDREGATVRIPMTRATATEIVRSAMPVLLPVDGDARAGAGVPADGPSTGPAKERSQVSQVYVQLGRCEGALFTASTAPGEPTHYFRDGRKIARGDLPEAIKTTAGDVISR